MGFFDRFFSRKSAGSVIAEILRGTQTASGAHVTVDSAMRVAAVYACVRVISETIGSLPLNVYQRRSGGGKTIRRDHPLFRLLHSQPNSWQTSFEFRELMQAHFELRGNAYAYKSMDSRGNILELLPIHPDRVEVKRLRDMSLEYHVQLEEGSQERIVVPQAQMFHLRGLSTNGYTGRSTLQDAREIIGVAISTQEFAGRFYKNDATPSVVLTHPGKLSKEVSDRIRDSWNQAFAGSGNARKTAVLEEGMSIERLTLSAEDAQFLETRKFQRSEIAGLFRVPAHLIGDLERATFSNIEAQQIDFVMHCIRPRLVRWEQALSRDLFIAPDLYFPEFNVEGLLRGDAKSRFDSYAIARNWGWLSVNEIRERENLNPIPEGDIYLQPLNMSAAGEPVAVRHLVHNAETKATYQGEDIDLTPTETMKDEAEQGLEWRREYGRGGTEVGIARARDISNGRELSPETVRRMYSYFSRHEVDKEAEGFNPGEEGYPSNGRIAWALWGGDPGYRWAKAKVEQLNRLDEQEE